MIAEVEKHDTARMDILGLLGGKGKEGEGSIHGNDGRCVFVPSAWLRQWQSGEKGCSSDIGGAWKEEEEVKQRVQPRTPTMGSVCFRCLEFVIEAKG